MALASSEALRFASKSQTIPESPAWVIRLQELPGSIYWQHLPGMLNQ